METLTTAARLRRLSTALVLAAVLAGGAGLAAAKPAFADEHDRHRERVEHDRGRHEPPRVAHYRHEPPRPVYAPPPVVYAPPPPPPGITFSLNIR